MTHRWLMANPARLARDEPGSASRVGAAADRTAEPVDLPGVDHPPDPAPLRCGAAAGHRFPGQPGHPLGDRVAERVVRADRLALDIDFLDRVGQPVHRHVQPRAGYNGYAEVEIFNQEVWDTPAEQVAATLKARFAQLLG